MRGWLFTLDLFFGAANIVVGIVTFGDWLAWLNLVIGAICLFFAYREASG